MVILVDFDGTLTFENGDGTFSPNQKTIAWVRNRIALGDDVRLWTARTGKDLIEALKTVKEWGIPMQYAGFKPKADIYVDDKSIRWEELQ